MSPGPKSLTFSKSLQAGVAASPGEGAGPGTGTTGTRDTPTVHGPWSQSLAWGRKHRESGVLEPTKAELETVTQARCHPAPKAEPGPQLGACCPHPSFSEPSGPDLPALLQSPPPSTAFQPPSRAPLPAPPHQPPCPRTHTGCSHSQAFHHPPPTVPLSLPVPRPSLGVPGPLISTSYTDPSSSLLNLPSSLDGITDPFCRYIFTASPSGTRPFTAPGDMVTGPQGGMKSWGRQ